MQTEGRLTICDRCGKKVFSRCIGQTSENCGQQTWGVFEELPEGWTTEQEKFLCPACSREFAVLKKDIYYEQSKISHFAPVDEPPVSNQKEYII